MPGGGGGHRSHPQGTELDLVGYNAVGRLWTPAQRVAVAVGGAQEPVPNRFGLYTQGYFGNGALHIGCSGIHRPPAMGGCGKINGPASRAFKEPSEQKFVAAFNRGDLPRRREEPHFFIPNWARCPVILN